MTHRMDHFPEQLSGGEKQKAAIARAIVHKPRLLIADEPTGNLDPRSTQEIVDILLKIHSLDTTVILASHDEGMVNAIQKRVVMMHEGRVISDIEQGGYDLDALRNLSFEIHIDASLNE